MQGDCILLSLARGGVAQLGERLPCKQEASGSNPLISTTYFSFVRKKSKQKKAKVLTELSGEQSEHGLIAQLVRARA